jgi:hypothetical protein
MWLENEKKKLQELKSSTSSTIDEIKAQEKVVAIYQENYQIVNHNTRKTSYL